MIISFGHKRVSNWVSNMTFIKGKQIWWMETKKCKNLNRRKVIFRFDTKNRFIWKRRCACPARTWPVLDQPLARLLQYPMHLSFYAYPLSVLRKTHVLISLDAACRMDDRAVCFNFLLIFAQILPNVLT